MWYTHHRKVNCRYTEETATSDVYRQKEEFMKPF